MRWRVRMDTSFFRGCMPALVTPVAADGSPAYDHLVRKGRELMTAGMSGVVYCGSMGEWPLLSDAQRQEGVRRLVEAGVPVVVGTGAQSPAEVLRLLELARRAAAGDPEATRLARELDDALHVLSTFDEGPDLVLYYKRLAVLLGDEAYARPVDPGDVLGASQERFVETQLRRCQAWWRAWPGRVDGAAPTPPQA